MIKPKLSWDWLLQQRGSHDVEDSQENPIHYEWLHDVTNGNIRENKLMMEIIFPKLGEVPRQSATITKIYD